VSRHAIGWLTAACGLILVTMSPAAAQDQPAEAVEASQAGDVAVDEQAAEEALRAALTAAGDDAAARNTAAVAFATWLEERGRFLQASGLRRIVRESDPTPENAAAEARAVLGFAEQVLSGGGPGAGIRAAFEDARIALSRARELGADDVETALGLARCAAAQGDPDTEIRELQGAAERWPDDGRARRALGFAFLNAGRNEEAVPILRDLSEATPDDLLLARALSFTARGAGMEELAVEAAVRAIDAAPTLPDAWQSLWAVYAPAKRHGELANAVMDRANVYPESAAGAHYAGFALASARRYDDALTWLEKAWTLQPENHEARLEAARVRITAKGDEAGAAELCRDVIAASPGNAGALDLLSFLAVKLGNEQRYEEAIPYFRAVAEARPEGGQVWANLALTLRWAGHFDDADAAYRKAEENAPGDAQIRNDHGLLLLVMRRDEDATRVYLEAHDVDPLANDCVENLGFMARERGDLAAALQWFQTAWKAARRRGDATVATRQRRNADDVRFPLPPLR
jgi:tetratricopeptide (TPR) repeat protein